MNSPEHSEIPENTYEIQLTPCKSLSRKSRTSINLFDFAVEVVPRKKTQKTEYENQLHKETVDWNHLLKDKINDIKRLETSKVVIDKSILSPEQVSYLDCAKNTEELVKCSETFLLKAKRYLERYQYIIELQENLADLAEQQLNAATFDLIYSCKYKKANCSGPV